MSSFTIRASNFRVLERLAWAPRGLCVLSGANGTGKTTTLDALRFLQAVFLWGHDSGLRRVSGAQLLRMQAPPDEPVVFSIQTGDLRWVLRFPMSAQGLQGHFGEELHRGDQVVLRAGMHQDHWFLGTERQEHGEEPRCCAKQLWDRGGSPWMRPLVDLLTGLRVYDAYSLNQVKRVEPVSQGDAFLHGTGRNLWSVLSNWKGAPLRYRGQFDWVMAEARRAFPGIAGTVEFDRGIPYLFGPGAKDAAEGLLPSRVADGHLTGLLHLTAVAGAPLLPRRSVRARGLRSPDCGVGGVRIALLTTGKMEHIGLPKALHAIFPDHDFVALDPTWPSLRLTGRHVSSPHPPR